MPSFITSATLLATTVFSLGVHAQEQYTASSINVTSVPISTRTQWCNSQVQSCPLLCLQLPGASSTTNANDCDPNTLKYDCVCGNGQSPNASEYSQTLPYFICTEFGNECVAACNGQTGCQSACRDNHPCGAQNPTRVNTSTITSTSMTATAGGATGSAGVVYTGLGGSGASPTGSSSGSSSGSGSKSGSQAALDIGRSYGLAIVFSGIFAGFALVM